ncbi:MAG: molecular chaperone TorD family protein [Candidatus Thiodiazotropha sp.]
MVPPEPDSATSDPHHGRSHFFRQFVTGASETQFLNGQPRTVAPPFESVYRHQQMEGPVVQRLADLYRDAGLEIEGTPADFLGTQLRFAAYLDESQDPRARDWRERLWRDHLLGWLPGFVSDLCEHSRLLIYRLWGGQLSLLATAMQRELAPV